MQNLAGVTDCDKIIALELDRCRIPKKGIERTNNEVPYSLIGKLGSFTFTRAWYYWVVEGLVPIDVAEELYADPVGIHDIRVDGFAGNLSPNSGAEWFTGDGAKVISTDMEPEYRQIVENHGNLYTKEPIFSDDPESIDAKLYITSYHIDSEVGLRIFADTLRAHNLIPEATPV